MHYPANYPIKCETIKDQALLVAAVLDSQDYLNEPARSVDATTATIDSDNSPTQNTGQHVRRILEQRSSRQGIPSEINFPSQSGNGRNGSR